LIRDSWYRDPETDEEWLAEAAYRISFMYDRQTGWRILMRVASKYQEEGIEE
jgi:hypothetical protein